MKCTNIKFEIVTYENLELACGIQNEIFPLEDARQNYIEQIEHDPCRKEIEYFVVYKNNVPIGVTGIYSYNEYPTVAWLGWFGVLEKYRNKGFGGNILDKTNMLAREKGYKEFRIYTDEFATNAHRLYSSREMVCELYDNPDDKDEYIDAKIYIYSMSLNDKEISPWNNKLLGLKEQSRKEHDGGK